MPDCERPAIFCESNRTFWEHMRRLLVWLVHEIDKWYGFGGETLRKS